MAFSVAGLAYPTTAVVPCVGCISSNTIGLFIHGCWQMHPLTVMDTAPPNPCARILIINQVWPPSLVDPLCRVHQGGRVKVAAPETCQCHLILADSMRRSLMPGVSAPPLSTPWLCVKACSYVQQSYQIWRPFCGKSCSCCWFMVIPFVVQAASGQSWSSLLAKLC